MGDYGTGPGTSLVRVIIWPFLSTRTRFSGSGTCRLSERVDNIPVFGVFAGYRTKSGASYETRVTCFIGTSGNVAVWGGLCEFLSANDRYVISENGRNRDFDIIGRCL